MNAALTEVRVPTYARPALLERALRSLQAQSDPNWRCRVFDDSADDASLQVCRRLGDARILHSFNQPRRFAAGNIDQCFAQVDDADFAFVLEDDNLVLPTFIEANIAAVRAYGAPIVLRNQHVAPADVDIERVEKLPTILEGRFHERVYAPQEFRVSALFSLGVSNGGLFWSREALTDFEVRAPGCDAVLQEHLRAALVRDDVFVARTPLAIWTDNAGDTQRHSGGGSGFWKRELRLKKAQIALRRLIARELRRDDRYDLVASTLFNVDLVERQRDLAKSLLPWPAKAGLSLGERTNLAARGLAILLLGDTPEDFSQLMRTRLPMEPA
ncbi:MAG: glycosyltransferase family A protein [Phenylobacterium sp.]|uniref:glycosyltransferase family 2 protein n=1 Tax=Phenylobacterium sp. TaxID=1871053 RepID=UPI002736AD06|nr:glycosyltransferase family A protein [Phenylobacterium sp.]MDP3174776.1 glycosyltransferase family A protein [Phenylobacterium sp.]